ncbi:uncharacterized protein LOC133719822 isoform X4 [Rosa rugosa]|uniref:uncharacterized protein LOC133719822 isoform X4 n=1 Tax=Rosa rugosa TaxID=74645 RepID=UPI002B405ACB|nr:uncharacterized protein LOC133719822 isoform X4 [Rosa rugosa]XP_062001993.1 uncharacterized protein LOC133719822 isoform X4 [Rosa rugosa]
MHTKNNLTGIKGLSEVKVDKICEAAEKIVIMNFMCACYPSYRSLHRPSKNETLEVGENKILDAKTGSASKRRRSTKTVKSAEIII